MKKELSRNLGFTLLEIMLVVTIIGLLAAIAIPSFVKAHITSQANACINNLRQMEGAVQTYALENKVSSTASYTISALQPYLRKHSGQGLPECPASGTYSAGSTVTNAPTCSLSGLTPPHELP